MSKVKSNSNSKVWAPPVFPVAGRLPGNVVAVNSNYKKQTAEEDFHHRQVNAKGQSQRILVRSKFAHQFVLRWHQ
ncbi:UNVERIFIED_ORG: hypothetical protein OKW15_004602 [Pseudomonas reinekei]|nr:hypothetical protein [Pseudomonas reinekei]